MGIELIDDKTHSPCGSCARVCSMWVLKSASVRVFDKVGAISLPVATSKLPSKQHVPCLLYSNSWYSTCPGRIGRVGRARSLAWIVFSSVLMTCTPCSCSEGLIDIIHRPSHFVGKRLLYPDREDAPNLDEV